QLFMPNSFEFIFVMNGNSVPINLCNGGVCIKTVVVPNSVTSFSAFANAGRKVARCQFLLILSQQIRIPSALAVVTKNSLSFLDNGTLVTRLTEQLDKNSVSIVGPKIVAVDTGMEI